MMTLEISIGRETKEGNMSDTPNLDAIEAEAKAAILAVYFDIYRTEHELDDEEPYGRPDDPVCSACKNDETIRMRQNNTGTRQRKNVGGVRSTVWKICTNCDRSAIEGESIMVHIVMRRVLNEHSRSDPYTDYVDKVFTHYFDAENYAKSIGGYVVSRDIQDFKTGRA